MKKIGFEELIIGGFLSSIQLDICKKCDEYLEKCIDNKEIYDKLMKIYSEIFNLTQDIREGEGC